MEKLIETLGTADHHFEKFERESALGARLRVRITVTPSPALRPSLIITFVNYQLRNALFSLFDLISSSNIHYCSEFYASLWLTGEFLEYLRRLQATCPKVGSFANITVNISWIHSSWNIVHYTKRQPCYMIGTHSLCTCLHWYPTLKRTKYRLLTCKATLSKVFVSSVWYTFRLYSSHKL